MERFVQNVAEDVGVDVPTFKLVLSLLISYPLSAIYRYYVKQTCPASQYAYFASTGFLLMVFNYGFDTWHSLASIVFTYVVLKFIGGTGVSVAIISLVLISWLLYGYSMTSVGLYDMSWTLSYCILVLRLIGLAWDVFDGSFPMDQWSSDQKLTALHDVPSALEILAHSYGFCGVSVGPQFPLRKLRSLVHGEFDDPATGQLRECRMVFLTRLLIGIAYMAFYFVMINVFPTEYFLTPEFKHKALWWKLGRAIVWSRVLLSRYIAVWIITEGACILCGLAYNGKNKQTGEDLWDGVRNVDLKQYEGGCSFRSMIDGFNMNTNQWAFRYIFKRLKFLNAKWFSQLITLTFLAFWHGLCTGYFACFYFEYVCLLAERQAIWMLQRHPRINAWLNSGYTYYPAWVIKKFFVLFGCAFGLLPFALLHFHRWWQVYKDLYFCGWLVFFVVWQLVFVLYCRMPFGQAKHA